MAQQNPIPVRIEDEYEDVIGKAMQGSGLEKLELMQASGLSMIDLEAALEGKFDPNAAYALAATLGLNAEALCSLAEGNVYPEVELPKGIMAYNAPYPISGYEEMTVNGYVAVDSDSGTAIGFDCGPTLIKMLSDGEKHSWTWDVFALTHQHEDHISKLADLKSVVPTPEIYAHDDSDVLPVNLLEEGDTFQIGSMEISVFHTPGHSPDGLTFLIKGLEKPVLVVGDAIFSMSVGGIRKDYQQTLANIREKILGQPPETLILPGHGPVTTVEFEKKNNCFFPPES